MVRVGFVGLDTSHPESFVQILGSMNGVRAEAVYDPLDVRDDAYVDRFCADHGCRRCDSPEELADRVDAAMMLSVDWDRHLAQARPFMKKGLPVYVDKPIAGNVGDLEAFRSLARETGAPLLAGSGWRMNDPVMRAGKDARDKDVSCAVATAPGPFFFYGIHAVELLLGLLGPGVVSVQALRHKESGGDAGSVVGIHHRRGTVATAWIQAAFRWRSAAYEVDGHWLRAEFSPGDIHRGVCDRFIEMVRSKRSLFTHEELAESARVMLAAEQSARSGCPVDPRKVDPSLGFDGAAFAVEYRRQREERGG